MDSAPPNRSLLVTQATAGARVRGSVCEPTYQQCFWSMTLEAHGRSPCPCKSKGKTAGMEKYLRLAKDVCRELLKLDHVEHLGERVGHVEVGADLDQQDLARRRELK